MEVPNQVIIHEQPGNLSNLKMSQIMQLIVAYGMAHPEVCADQKQEGNSNG